MKQSLKSFLVRCFRSWSAQDLPRVLARLGVRSGDVLMVHASWGARNGCRDRPAEVVAALRAAIAPDGLLVMPSLTYQNESSRAFLARGGVMDVRRSPSRMGLLSEVFRRGRDVRRSLSPTHPLLAAGPRAEEFIGGHEAVLQPFGRGSPFERLLDWGGRILTIDAPFSTITYTHFLEDRIAPALPFSLYDPAPMTGRVVDADGRTREVPVQVIAEAANALRREERLVARLAAEGLFARTRIGNARLVLIDVRAMTACVDRMTASGETFFDAPPAAPSTPVPVAGVRG